MTLIEKLTLFIVALICASIITVLLCGCATPKPTKPTIPTPPLPIATLEMSNAMNQARAVQSAVIVPPKPIIIMSADWPYLGSNYVGFYAASPDAVTWSNVYEFIVTNACTVAFTNLKTATQMFYRAGSHN